ncbi:hypothetical protein HPB51_022038 [Rhipicephalus microplus]|uniref:Endonuclease/exonuclease/phosphatase domain-containing protein n=1 Tax=Rhipicephalus microplus TaxID=6941 RepID=A0A9J6DXG2_RHIMP|nr:hypothetical protein HPB51_022038 [Rhipicephalus microplus]
MTGDNSLIVLGDFNASSTEWGHLKSKDKGTKLTECANPLDLQLINNLSLPSRRGNSVQRDTMPDLTFTKNVRATWDNHADELGIDHCILQITAENEVKAPRKFTIMDWDQFRKVRKQKKKHDLKEAWRKNKLNRHLRTKIADLSHEIESQAKTLCAQQWNNTCDEADGKLRRGSKWGLLKHLMADSDKPTRGGTQQQIERLVHKHAQDSGGSQAPLKMLGQKYC